ncbi:conserved hypothetical protein [Lodderomyces elongisporus NRRL YB-4239]|uniref:Xaa-Pro aminopeptidase P n=1 Tax=Lodderomyces elongisporus (strain ATCC 11503 / CBS 2605 / JCM 1781 / NBRC 1676 / NRRL YB-4239) TaxID=379508 RepID=A5DSH4_LODEL|nr:conserved hypothetical protein [Lodderomyces elongisporus NRRL YB-4239]
MPLEEKLPLLNPIDAESQGLPASSSKLDPLKYLLYPFSTCIPRTEVNQAVPDTCKDENNFRNEITEKDSLDDENSMNDKDAENALEFLPDLPYVVNPVILPVSKDDAGLKLKKLRRYMLKNKIGVYIITSEDEHQSEYTALADRRREYISGFTGSAGVVLITLTNPSTLQGDAYLSTDGRYFLQAEKQLDGRHWKLIKEGQKGVKPWTQLAIELAANNTFSSVISCDGRTLSFAVGNFFEKQAKAHNFAFRPSLQANLVDLVWGKEKPTRSQQPVYELGLEYSGEDTNVKVTRIRTTMQEFGASFYILTELDSIAWLFNLRCDDDIPFSPVFFAYSVITLSKVYLYINPVKIPKDHHSLQKHLSSVDGLTIKEYNQFYYDISQLKAGNDEKKPTIVLPSQSSTPYALMQAIPSLFKIIHHSIAANLKTFKNKVELSNAKVAQHKDSLAFIIFSSWLQHHLITKRAKVSEYDAACKIYDIRRKIPNFKGLSYETISLSGANAAIIHYAPTKDDNAIIDPKKVYLIDSGAHYLEGTTDITRTYYFGRDDASSDYKKYYTLVLKGHLAIATARFPADSPNTGVILDAYSRQPLWNHGLDFNHGVGHGIGSFGLVHEGPFYILTASRGTNNSSTTNLYKPGVITSNEPGYYIDGEVGFRIESEIEIIELDQAFGKARNGKPYLGFSYLTKVPFCQNLIDKQHLSSVELKWINRYHQSIREQFEKELLELGEHRALEWLRKETAAII